MVAAGRGLPRAGGAHRRGEPALAQQGLDEPFQTSFKKALEGKAVAYVPVAMNFDLAQGWYAGVKSELEPFGVNSKCAIPIGAPLPAPRR